MAWKELAFSDEVILNSDISEAEGFLRKTGAGAYEAIKTNMNASAAPTANEDSGDGYAVGSRWFDTTANKEYVCLDATPTAAIWTETTGAGGVSDHGALTGLADDDHTQYFLVAGTRAASGSFDMAGNEIHSIGTIRPDVDTAGIIMKDTDGNTVGILAQEVAAVSYALVCNEPIAMGTNKIVSLGNPVDAQDAATKSWVDAHDWAAADITSGILAVARGGTGVSGDTYDADKVDGKHATDFLLLDGTQAMAADINFAKHNADAMCIQPLASAPATPGMAQMYYNTTDDHLYVYAS